MHQGTHALAPTRNPTAVRLVAQLCAETRGAGRDGRDPAARPHQATSICASQPISCGATGRSMDCSNVAGTMAAPRRRRLRGSGRCQLPRTLRPGRLAIPILLVEPSGRVITVAGGVLSRGHIAFDLQSEHRYRCYRAVRLRTEAGEAAGLALHSIRPTASSRLTEASANRRDQPPVRAQFCREGAADPVCGGDARHPGMPVSTAMHGDATATEGV